jgi:hypothetical protein
MFFTEAALEQATAATVAAHRAEAIHRRAATKAGVSLTRPG